MSSNGAKCDIFFGSSKSTKTSQLGKIAEYFFTKTGKPMLLYSADNGGWDPIEHIVAAGMIHAHAIRSLPYAPEAIDRLSQGWVIGSDNKLKPALAGYWEKYSVVAFEGLASIGEWMMDYFSVSGQKLGMSQSFTNIQIGDTKYSGVGQDHYGYVQGQLLRCVVNSSRLPVDRVVWTSLETKGKDEITGTAMIGPTLVGNKKVDKVGQYFGNMIHLDFVEEIATDPKVKTPIITAKPVMFLRPHQDPTTKLMIPSGTRAPSDFAHEVPAYLEPPDAGDLYRILDDLKRKASDSLKQKGEK